MLRINFTADDIARTRIAAGPDPLWELVLALQMLTPQRGDLLFGGWRREAGDALRRAGLGPWLRLLLALTPNVGYFPDFLNPIDAMRGLEHGLEAIRRTGKPALQRDMRHLARNRRLPARARDIAEGDPGTLTELTDSMRTCHDAVVAPYRHSIETAFERDRAAKANALASSGVEGLLRSLDPLATWSSGELRVPTHRDQELRLDGRGLVLIPSYFCVSGPLTMLDPTLPPVLIYPVARQPDTLPARAVPRPEALCALIGATRTAVLQVISTRPRTTDELAHRVGISPASASEHAAVLRRAGLVTSHRDGHRMQHQPTALGLALLTQTRQTPFSGSPPRRQRLAGPARTVPGSANPGGH
ncbi:winged helix-turn-helix domain-containing protein [Micromonospora sp. CPCC 205371]|nr:winged helix-turn-helix domain-containing protein [Micromonospora sp. CPCC 205371]